VGNDAIYSIHLALGFSAAMAWLKTAEPAKLSCFEPSQAGLLANDQIWLGLARELA